jgi:hypothetical protein
MTSNEQINSTKQICQTDAAWAMCDIVHLDFVVNSILTSKIVFVLDVLL